MSTFRLKGFITDKLVSNPRPIVLIILLINLLLRLFIYSKTVLFQFEDYSTYLERVERLLRGEHQYLLEGNFLFGISYIGYFWERLTGGLISFFIFNCLIASLTSFIIYCLIVKITNNTLSGIVTLLLQTLYTEYVVFSSVFYTPVIMIFLLSLFLLLLYLYVKGRKNIDLISSASGLLLIFLLTFFFKPELQYLPWFLIIFSLLFIRRNRVFFYKICGLAVAMIFVLMVFNRSNIIFHPPENVISNAFVFFGHTDYGGDGGEGSFVYPANKARYKEALAEYCRSNNIDNPTASDYNSFQREEMMRFITHHPIKWIGLQFTKFFRTFGVVPETTSFKVLYTGLFKGTLWLTSIVVVAPVALIILLFILFFNHSAIVLLIKGSTAQRLNGTMALQPDDITTQELAGSQLPITDHRSPITDYHDSDKTGFLYIYLLLFVYYIIATIFYGQYQERYRLPLMVVFIIPVLGFFIASFNIKQFQKKRSLIIKSAVIVLFLTVWVFQAKKAISNKERFNNAIESVNVVLE